MRLRSGRGCCSYIRNAELAAKLPADWTGADGGGIRPIRDWSEIARPLDRRPLAGFGGVSEYGITVRWDKNFLTLLHVTLARRPRFSILGGVRFGGTITAELPGAAAETDGHSRRIATMSS